MTSVDHHGGHSRRPENTRVLGKADLEELDRLLAETQASLDKLDDTLSALHRSWQ